MLIGPSRPQTAPQSFDPAKRPSGCASNGVRIRSDFPPAPKTFLRIFAADDRARNRGLIMRQLRPQNEASGLVLDRHYTAVEAYAFIFDRMTSPQLADMLSG